MEKYGEMPKRFSKKWWEHYWYYYKAHMILGGIAALLIGITCAQCAGRINYDMTISYVGCEYFEQNTITALEDKISQLIDDKNNDGKIYTHIIQMTVAKEGTPAAGSEYNSAVLSKEAVEFQAGETYMFLFGRQELDRLLNRESAEQIFVKTTDIYKSDLPDEKLIRKENIPYAVHLKGSKFLSENGIYGDDIYMALRCIRSRDTDKEEEQAAYSNAVKLAEYIVGYGFDG